MTVRDLGLVSQVFDEQKLKALTGAIALGHVRYSTTGSSAWENAQPVYRSDRRQVALAHNGNLINAVELHSELSDRGVQFRSTSDSEIIAALLSTHEADTIEEALADVMPRLEGAFSTVVMTQESRGRLPRRRRAAAAVARAGSATATAWPPRAARSTSSARSSCARSSPARWSRSASAGSRRSRWWTRPARPSASSSTSTSRARTRSSRATAPRCHGARWARSSGARRPPTPTW